MESNNIIENLSTIRNENEIKEYPNNLHSTLTTLSLSETTNDDNFQEEKMETRKESVATKTISVPLRPIPAHNIPEKIILCLDTCTDSEFTAFTLGDGSTYAPLYMLKRITEIFVQNKNYIDPRHEFALLTLNSKNVKWIREFTNNPNDIINALSSVSECEHDEEFKLTKLLDTVWQNVNIPKPTNQLNIPYIVRLILLYSRSCCSSVIKENYEELLGNPYFTIDVILTQEETPAEKCQEIFNCLQKLDDKSYSYKFKVGRNVTMLHDSMAKLLSHPLQRPLQNLAMYEISQDNIKPKLDKEE